MVTESAGDTAADAVASVALEGCSRVPCVIYAAKSTADVRGSSPGQLRDCREVISADGERWLVAEYSDEAFSAFRRSRGPDLAKAMRHAEELAAEHGESELWAQHSDRLARGDGRSARHAVEVALWALKHDVRVRTLQDPDTFRDLLYAVVTGQRNNEDSRRKGRSSKAGRRRAAERGDYIGYLPDGYRIAVEVDGWGVVKKRMVLDPQRQPAIELLFRLALRGKRSGAIARVLNDAGWLTKPRRKGSAPRTWTVNRVIEILKNPRYAGLAMFDGEVVAHGCWPAYISERQHKRIRAQLARRRPSKYPRELESYLLAKVGKCGLCGSTLLALTSNPHRDGTLIRRYVCASRYHGRHAGRCEAMRMDAGLVEAMFVSSLGGLLLDGARAHREGELPPLAASSDVDSERQRLRDAILAGDDPGADSALEALFAHMQPEAALVRDAVSSHRRTRELQQLQEFRAWITQEATGRTDASRGKAREAQRAVAIVVRERHGHDGCEHRAVRHAAARSDRCRDGRAGKRARGSWCVDSFRAAGAPAASPLPHLGGRGDPRRSTSLDRRARPHAPSNRLEGPRRPPSSSTRTSHRQTGAPTRLGRHRRHTRPHRLLRGA